ncbi:hypothetical protein Rsub_07020 [Raphidocelis subcapitata]|uniref:FAS1 domain-containing protein n=1 Tax=Raphidocelis subcapitata TaxID=307507 RepID=A0A2V0P3Q2_9CHLO|nr:hypothetical protein Rsub_07020 [Raphidocelis subcapitata]|eukprot:GBF94486.1 hypothetical protein Rsub_07020 [Raphidocelis subcapitata]
MKLQLACLMALLAASAARGASAEACLTAADVFERELPGLQLSPVFKRIYGNPALKARARESGGLLLIPTAEAWDAVSSVAGMQNINLKGENVTAALMTGGLPLYWLAQDSKLDPRTLPIGGPPSRVETAARWRCSLPEKPGSVGYGMVLSRRADGVYAEHGGSNSEGPARLAEPVEPLPGTCPGLNVYVVEEIPWPCSSLAALATEIDNASQNGCRRNADTAVSGALAVGGHRDFLQLLVATGLLPSVDKTSTPFTVLAPTDAALESAAARGAFKYGELFATNRTLLAQIIGYHIVSGQALKQPNQQSAERMTPTLMAGNPGCGARVGPSWSADGIIRGGRGVSRVGRISEACHSTIVSIDTPLLPCCSTFEGLLEGNKISDGLGAGHNLSAIAQAPQLQGFLAHAARLLRAAPRREPVTVLVPSSQAWKNFLRDVARADIPINDALYDAVFGWLVAPGSSWEEVEQVMADPKQSSELNVSLQETAEARLCPDGGRPRLAVTGAPAAAPPAARRRLAGVAAPPAWAPGLRIVDGDDTSTVAVTGVESTCGGGAVLFVDAVPRPCQLPALLSDAQVAAALAAAAGEAPANGAAAGGRGAAAAVAAAAAAAVAAALVL